MAKLFKKTIKQKISSTVRITLRNFHCNQYYYLRVKQFKRLIRKTITQAPLLLTFMSHQQIHTHSTNLFRLLTQSIDKCIQRKLIHIKTGSRIKKQFYADLNNFHQTLVV